MRGGSNDILLFLMYEGGHLHLYKVSQVPRVHQVHHVHQQHQGTRLVICIKCNKYNRHHVAQTHQTLHVNQVHQLHQAFQANQHVALSCMIEGGDVGKPCSSDVSLACGPPLSCK